MRLSTNRIPAGRPAVKSGTAAVCRQPRLSNSFCSSGLVISEESSNIGALDSKVEHRTLLPLHGIVSPRTLRLSSVSSKRSILEKSFNNSVKSKLSLLSPSHIFSASSRDTGPIARNPVRFFFSSSMRKRKARLKPNPCSAVTPVRKT